MQVTDEMVEAAWEAYDNAPGYFTNSELMRAALTAALAEMWRPIETAPRDRAILLAAYIVPSDEAQRNGLKPFWHIETGRAFGTNLDRWTNVLGERPSRWMPLPAPPSKEGE